MVMDLDPCRWREIPGIKTKSKKIMISDLNRYSWFILFWSMTAGK